MPVVLKVWDGFFELDVEPSPKSHRYDFIFPSESVPSPVNCTVNGAEPLFLLIIILAEGGLFSRLLFSFTIFPIYQSD